jgi:nitrous oxidase accessory protein NosD
LRQGALFDVSTPTKLLNVNFTAKPGAAHKDKISGNLTAVVYYELQPDRINTTPVYAESVQGAAVTEVSTQARFDINGDGKINMQDVSAIIYNYYLMREDGAKWSEAEAFDANYDGFVDISDLIIICSYFT